MQTKPKLLFICYVMLSLLVCLYSMLRIANFICLFHFTGGSDKMSSASYNWTASFGKPYQTQPSYAYPYPPTPPEDTHSLHAQHQQQHQQHQQHQQQQQQQQQQSMSSSPMPAHPGNTADMSSKKLSLLSLIFFSSFLKKSYSLLSCRFESLGFKSETRIIRFQLCNSKDSYLCLCVIFSR